MIMDLLNRSYIQLPHERAAFKQAEAEHAKGVTVRMNPRTFKVEYVRPDGSIVPDYDYYLALAKQGKI